MSTNLLKVCTTQVDTQKFRKKILLEVDLCIHIVGALMEYFLEGIALLKTKSLAQHFLKGSVTLRHLLKLQNLPNVISGAPNLIFINTYRKLFLILKYQIHKMECMN